MEQLVELQLDVLGLQEVRRLPDQARWIVRHLNGRSASRGLPYRAWVTYKRGLAGLREGIAVVSHLALLEQEMLDLGHTRVGQRLRLRLPEDRVLDFYNTHLHHLPFEEPSLRPEQARRIVRWMARHPNVPQVLVGDFNAPPGSLPIQILTEHLHSAYALVHGADPPRTFPTPLRPDEPPLTLDYIFVNDRVTVHDAWLTFDAVDPTDSQLAASDHYGLAAIISVCRGSQ